MDGHSHSHYSDKRHSTFLARFKGKVASIGKNGHIGLAASTTKPIEKKPPKHNDVYNPSGVDCNAPYTVTGMVSF